ncbi:MAG: ATP-dependent Clp protease ATP-binding subunit [Spirochaetia bacterium]|nr:ATP-dependent Clp protease ATP-binding subunit [Spirochaetia bacterium]
MFKEMEPAGATADKKEKSATPMLDRFSKNLVEMARQGLLDPVIGRDREIKRLIHILARRKKNNPVLIGEPGVGKTAVVEGFAARIADGTAPEIFLGKKVMTLDLASMLAGTKYRGEFEERIKHLVSEVTKSDDIILYIDELHTIVGAGSSDGAMDAANMLKPALARGELQCIGSTTSAEYRKFIEKDGALERRFQPILVEEPDKDMTLEILKGIRGNYETFHNVSYSDEALETAIALSSRYISGRVQPDKAIDLLDEAGADSRVAYVRKPERILKLERDIDALNREKLELVAAQNYEKAAEKRDRIKVLREKKETAETLWRNKLKIEENIIDGEDICRTLAGMTGIPVSRLSKNETGKLLKIEDYIHKYLVGQDKAIGSIAAAIRRSRAGISAPGRPWGSFIFLGPTGVGKTYLAKILAEYLFGDAGSLVRIDMSDYMEKHTASRLVGAPPGYVGYGEGGVLTEKVRRKPYCVILFDEIEKAHPDVFNLLLQILEEGEIQDNLGRKVSFRNTIIIMTSNAGTREFSAGTMVGFRREQNSISADTIKSAAMNELKHIFRPEFLNRVDEIVTFDMLSQEQMRKIFRLMVRELSDRLSEKGMALKITPKAEDFFIQKGMDYRYGARPLRRLIQKELEDPVSLRIIGGELTEGMTVRVSCRNGNLCIECTADGIRSGSES